MGSYINLVTVGFKVSVEHKEYLLILAKEKGMTISEYLRSLIPELPKNGTYIRFEESESNQEKSKSTKSRGEKAKIVRPKFMDMHTVNELNRNREMQKGLTALIAIGFFLFFDNL